MTEAIAINDVNAAFGKMHHGDVLRSVVAAVSGEGRSERTQAHDDHIRVAPCG